MSARFVLIVLAATCAIVSADDCDCKDPGDTKELWEFFKNISPDIDTLSDEDKDMYSVLPGLLSPLFECNCLDKSRRKREAPSSVEEVSTTPASEEETVEKIRALRPRKSIRFGTRICPTGFARVGYLCVQAELLE